MASWKELNAELDRWPDAGLIASFWWRDDDAVTVTPQLERLLGYAEEVPLTLAVIPALATDKLAQRLRDFPSVAVLQHGWKHTDYGTEAMTEYPAWRSDAEVSREIVLGRQLLDQMFGCQSIPVFVPPFHGFDTSYLPLLVRHGITAISSRGVRPNRFAAAGLLQVNTHVAPIKWTTPPSFTNDEEYLREIVHHLHARRTQQCDADEPTGILTHHLMQTEKSYWFLSRLVSVVLRHPAGRWLRGREVFSSAMSAQ